MQPSVEHKPLFYNGLAVFRVAVQLTLKMANCLIVNNLCSTPTLSRNCLRLEFRTAYNVSRNKALQFHHDVREKRFSAHGTWSGRNVSDDVEGTVQDTYLVQAKTFFRNKMPQHAPSVLSKTFSRYKIDYT